MTAMFTRDAVEAYLRCPFKAFLKLNGEQGTATDYEAMITTVSDMVRLAVIDRLAAQHSNDQIERGITLDAAALKHGNSVILDATYENGTFSVQFDGLQKVSAASKLGAFRYVPMLFVGQRSVRKEQKFLLSLFATIPIKLQGKRPEFGLVWCGTEARARKVRIQTNSRELEPVLAALRQMRDESKPPPLILNDHCWVCEFRDRCHAQALQEDNLSLLRGVGLKEIKKYARKGILTVTQLSHTFRPRRKGKRGEPHGTKRHHALQAMAVRDKTIYVLGHPQLPIKPIRVFVDVEANPEERFVYLIGMLVVTDGIEQRYSFWADSQRDEVTILGECLAILTALEDFTLYCYGSYEQTFLKRMRTHESLQAGIDRVLSATVNILSVIYAHIYFPTYSDRLKDIGTCIGCRWTAPEASGLQSIVWRNRWETNREDVWKEKLRQYNFEDCIALRAVTECVSALTTPHDTAAESSPTAIGPFRVATVQEFDQQSRTRKWGVVQFVYADYEFINRCAYFDYQQQRVFVQTSKTLRKNPFQTTRQRISQLPATKDVFVTAAECETCHSKDVVTIIPTGIMRAPRVKRVFDIVGSRSGLKLNVIDCRSKIFRCRSCGATFVPAAYRRVAHYFHGIKSWAMYQHIAHQLSFGTIRDMIQAFFNFPIPKRDVHGFKTELTHFYQPSQHYIWEMLLRGPLLHVDETQLRLKSGKTAYVWACTNLDVVAYLCRPSREGEFLRELLKDFRGVLVTDFYTAYDSLACFQQKCLVHLIRDMNDDLRIAGLTDGNLDCQPAGAAAEHGTLSGSSRRTASSAPGLPQDSRDLRQRRLPQESSSPGIPRTLEGSDRVALPAVLCPGDKPDRTDLVANARNNYSQPPLPNPYGSGRSGLRMVRTATTLRHSNPHQLRPGRLTTLRLRCGSI